MDSLDAAAGHDVITIFSPVFCSNESLIPFLIHHNVLSVNIVCRKCNSQMGLIKQAKALDGYTYRCSNNQCRAWKSIRTTFRPDLPKVSLIDICRAAFLFVCNCQNYFIFNNCSISENTYVKLKKILVEQCKQIILNTKRKLGGPNKTIQIDETAFKKGQIIRNPSSYNDNDPATLWLIGLIEEETGSIHLEFVQNRKIETIRRILDENVNNYTIIKTDGYPSYIQPCSEKNYVHIVVNHKHGFRNEKGHTTNTIEGLWSLLKYDIKRRKGVSRNVLLEFIFEFSWRNRYVKNNNPRTWKFGLLSLLNKLKI